MDKKALVELLRYSSPYSILVVRWDGRLMEVCCPFQVRVKEDFDVFARGRMHWVSSVLVSTQGTTVFRVLGKSYYYWHFDILI